MELAIAEAEQLIKNYCSLSYVPGELLYTWAELAIEQLDEQVELSSISLGDSAYGFRAPARLSTDHRMTLNRFRKGLFSHV